MNLKRRVWLEVDLNKLKRNYQKIATAVTPAKVLCVMKANAYGLGVLPYATALA
ncbi:MAG: alanine racemase, partial [Kiritimatiellae bacterium]|nr:alanine racemase [Kiritimatiellia bacterium]